MMKNRIKVSVLILFGLILINLNLKTVLSFDGNCMDYTEWADANRGSGGSGGGGSGGGGSGYQGCPGTGKHIYCNINYVRNEENIKLEENLYDTKGNFIGSALMLKDKLVLTAGRFVGIDAYEEYKKTFYVTMNPVCREGVMVPVTVTIHHYISCWGEDEVRVDCGYDESYTYWVLDCRTCYVSNCDCRGAADAKLNELANQVDLNPSYDGKRQDVNDINKGTKANGDPTINVTWNEEFSTKEIEPSQPADCNSSTVSKTVTMTYTYNLTPSWMDPLTGKVKYESNCGETGENAGYNKCITEEEKSTYIKVPEMYINRNGKNIRIGQYFVPLNAKSTDLLKYYLYPRMSRAPISEAMCLTLINKYSTKTSTGEYWADFLGFKDSGESMYPLIQTAEGARKQVQKDHGCRMGLYVSFKIQQEFYNELNSNLNGYEFYYRPIDYSEPFPNGMTKYGYWYGVYNKKSNSTKVIDANGKIDSNNSVDLDDSFSRVSYRTNNTYNEKTIRNYNKASSNPKDNRAYNSWLEMNTDGTSKFISGNYGISRNGCQSFYSLGCGPANSNWTQCKRITEKCN